MSEKHLAPVTPERARKALGRFIHSHFRKQDPEKECARFTIPVDEERDDDRVLSRFIRESEQDGDAWRIVVISLAQRLYHLDFATAEDAVESLLDTIHEGELDEDDEKAALACQLLLNRRDGAA